VVRIIMFKIAVTHVPLNHYAAIRN